MIAHATNRANRLWQVLLWSAVAVLVVGPPAYLGVLWTRQQWTIQELSKLGHAVNELSGIRENRLWQHQALSNNHYSWRRHWSGLYGAAFASKICHLLGEIPDFLAPVTWRPLFSPFPNLDLQVEIPEPRTGPNQRNAITTIAIEQAVKLASELNALHSLHIRSSRTGPLFDRTWAIRELSVENLRHLPAAKDTWNNLALERVDQSMPRLYLLSLSGVSWSGPVHFPEKGFNNLVTLILRYVVAERLQMCQRSGLKYMLMDGKIGELNVSDCPDLERLVIGSLGEPASIAVQRLPRLKALYVAHTNSLVLADLPQLETVYLGGNIRATHLQSLTGMPKLKRVGLDVSTFDGAMVDQLLRIKSLEELHLSSGKVRGNLARLAAHPSLQVLQFDLQSMDNQHMGVSEKDTIAEIGLKALMANRRFRVYAFRNFASEAEPWDEDDEEPNSKTIGVGSTGVVTQDAPAATAP